MTHSELIDIREKLIEDLKKDTKEESFPSSKAYKDYVNAVEEGIIQFYIQGLIRVLDENYHR